MLLLGMYVTIALLAVFIGMIAWRHLSVGVLGIGLFGAFGAFVAYTRPESRVTDVIPSLIGGVVGIIAIAVLARWASRRHRFDAAAYYGPRHRAAGAGWAA
jgi:sulfite oxidase